MVDELHSRGLAESAEGRDPAAAFAVVSAGLLVLGGLALLARSDGERPARRRRRFGLLAILASVAVYLLRPKPAVAEAVTWVPVEEPVSTPAPEAELPIPEDPEPEPEELLPAARSEDVAEDEPSGWHVIAEAREQGRARVDSTRPFVLIQSDEDEPAGLSDDEDELAHPDVVHAEAEQREPVEGIVNRVGLYSRRPEDSLEPAEAEGF